MSIADDSPDPASSADRRVEALVEEFLERLRAGQAPDRAAVVAAHPDLAAVLDRRLALVEMMYRVAQVAQAAQPAASQPVSAPAERALLLQCPHCGNRIQLVQAEPHEVTCQNCGSSFQVEPRATTDYRPDKLPRTIGKFEVVELLGRGAFGAVYKARDPELDRTVAVKVPRAGYFGSHEEQERFLREARSTARLNHPHIVPVHEIGHEHGVPYLVSDYIEGLTLADLLMGARPGFRESAELVARVAEALDYAHRKKIVHRDIKPGNILIDRLGRPHVTDFGLARREEGEITVTLEGQILGTPAYMAPEQAAGEHRKVDGRSDVYSLGVVLYELLTGELPFRGNQRMLLHQVLRDDPRPPRKLNDRIPRDLETVCLKCLQKEPHKRYGRASQLADDLGRFLRGEPILARPVGLAERLWKWVRRRPAVAALLAVSGVALLAVVGLGVGFLYNLRLQSAFRETQEQRERADMKTIEANQQRERAERQEALVRRLLYLSRINLADRAWHDANLARMDELLQEQKPGQADQDDLRGFEWFYLWQLRHSSLLTLKGHTAQVNSVAFSPDGRRLASGAGALNKPGEIKVWDAQAGQELLSLQGHSEIVWCVTFSRDGELLASASQDHTLKLWDAQTGREIRTFKGHTGAVRGVAFSPDDRRIASVAWEPGAFHKPCELKVWDAQTGRETVTLKGLVGLVSRVAFSPDGRRIVAGAGELHKPGVVKIWDAQTGQEVLNLQAPVGPVYQVAYSPDGTRLACASHDQSVKVWDAQTGRDLLFLGGHVGTVHGLAFSPDGQRLASAGAVDQTVQVWDAHTGHPVLSMKGHTGPVSSLAFSPDGRRLATASYDRTVKVWDAHRTQESHLLWGHTRPVECVAFSPDGERLASASWDGTVKLWEMWTDPDVRTCSYRPAVWLRGHTKPVEHVAFSPDGTRLASGSADQTVRVWDTRTGREALSLKGHTDTVWGVAFSPDGRHVASASADRTVKVWDAQTGREALTLKGHTEAVWGVAFSPDGTRLASGACDQTVKVWDAQTGGEVWTLKGHTSEVTSVVFSRDGKRLASSANDHTVKIWDAQTGQQVMTLNGHAGAVTRVTFSPDGTRLATASEGNMVKVWDAQTGEEALTLKGHTDSVQSVAFSPDGRRLASAGMDQTVRVWDASVGYELEGLPTTAGIGSKQRPAESAPKPANAKEATECFHRGYAAMNQGDYARALAEYTALIHFNPTYMPAYLHRAVAFYERGDLNQAIADNTEAIRLDPSYAPAYRNRGREYGEKEAYDLAIADFTRSIELEPKDAVAYYERGRNQAGKGDYPKAVADYTEAIKRDPKLAWAYRNRGEAYRALGEEKKAAEDELAAQKLSK